jgi:hypothetical protein
MYTTSSAVKWKEDRITPCKPDEAGTFPGAGFLAGPRAAWYSWLTPELRLRQPGAIVRVASVMSFKGFS